MKLRNGCLGQEDILRARLAIKEARDIDTRMLEVLKDASINVLSADDDHEVVQRAIDEVAERLYYLASLDALWANIEAVQEHMGALRTYECLEKEYLEKDVCDDGVTDLEGLYEGLGTEEKATEVEVQTAVMEEVDFGEEEPKPSLGLHGGYSVRMADLGAEAQAVPFVGPNDPRLLQYCSCRRKKVNKKARKKEDKQSAKVGKKEGKKTKHKDWIPDILTAPDTEAMVRKMAKKAKKAVKKAEKKAAKQEKKARRKLEELF